MNGLGQIGVPQQQVAQQGRLHPDSVVQVQESGGEFGQDDNRSKSQVGSREKKLAAVDEQATEEDACVELLVSATE